MTPHLFVYGTLRNDVHHPAHQLLDRYFTLLGKAFVQGKLYDCGEYPGAVPTAEQVAITGELYVLRNTDHFDEAMRTLDEYEGYLPAAPQRSLFRRALTTVQFNNQHTPAWIYWYNGDVSNITWIKGGDYLHQTE
jgi:gamma-glutamylcyclotransferase (GGCT)/AIG2-like uncharacterized protein YtfP